MKATYNCRVSCFLDECGNKREQRPMLEFKFFIFMTSKPAFWRARGQSLLSYLNHDKCDINYTYFPMFSSMYGTHGNIRIMGHSDHKRLCDSWTFKPFMRRIEFCTNICLQKIFFKMKWLTGWTQWRNNIQGQDIFN